MGTDGTRNKTLLLQSLYQNIFLFYNLNMRAVLDCHLLGIQDMGSLSCRTSDNADNQDHMVPLKSYGSISFIYPEFYCYLRSAIRRSLPVTSPPRTVCDSFPSYGSSIHYGSDASHERGIWSHVKMASYQPYSARQACLIGYQQGNAGMDQGTVKALTNRPIVRSHVAPYLSDNLLVFSSSGKPVSVHQEG